MNTKDLKTNSGYGASGTDLVPLLISTNGIPKNMTLTDGIPYNVWEGVVAVTSARRTFSIRYAAVPEDACIALATRTSRGSAFEKIQVNGAAEVIGEYTAAQAKNDCSSDKDNTIVWTTGS